MDDIELIKQKINIVDLAQEYLPLKKSGINFKANCPFHNEKTPSFFISPERGIFRCFGCGKSGDIFTFLMEKEGWEFKEALEVLAKRAGVILKKTAHKKDTKDKLYELNLKAQEFFHYLLLKHSLGKNAAEYLKKRGLTDESMTQFQLGYAPNSWDSLTKFLGKKGFSVAEIIESGLGVVSQNGCYDRFRGRVIFPLIDTRDRTVGFAGRIIYQGEPKYINNPQTPIFDKSNFLFGLNKAKSAIKSADMAVLVEGEMDVILSHQAGIKNMVASKGTALTGGQLDLIKKYTSNLSLGFDMDLAGDSASRRGIELADKMGLNIKVVELPSGKDAAELASQDAPALEQAITQALPVYDYYLNSVSKRFNLTDPSSLKKIGEELVPIWSKINDDIVREHYIQKLAALLRVDEVLIRNRVEKEKSAPVPNFQQALKQTKKDDRLSTLSRRSLLEEYLMSLLLHIPADLVFVPQFPETLFLEEKWRELYVLLVLYLDSISFKGRAFDINEFLKGVPRELVEEVDRLYLVEIDERFQNSRHWQEELEVVVSQLKKELVKASLERLSLEIKNAESFGKIELVGTLTKRFRDLSVKLKNL
ncbi:MAG: DNA primase [Candidatus Daviesbacteria bacterium]|nr:MAG: DNA primase [Candidatus Daviesbacteria bacterium]